MKLNRVKGNTYYINGRVNTGVITVGNSECILIDPGNAGQRAEKLIDVMESNNLKPVAILLTHEHTDHHGACYELLEHYGDIEIYASEIAALYISKPEIFYNYVVGGQYANLIDEHIRPYFKEKVCVDRYLHPGENTICGHKFKVYITPGHCTGGVTIETEDRVGFVGDVLISEKVLKLIDGFLFIYNPKDHHESLELLKNLDFEYLINGHSRQIYKGEEIGMFVQANIEAFDRYEKRFLSIFENGKKLTLEEALREMIKMYNLKYDYTEYHYYKAVTQSMVAWFMNIEIMGHEFTDEHVLRYFINR